MKNEWKDLGAIQGAGLGNMSSAELIETSGGYAAMLLAVPGAFKAIYELGKAVGRELYYLRND